MWCQQWSIVFVWYRLQYCHILFLWYCFLQYSNASDNLVEMPIKHIHFSFYCPSQLVAWMDESEWNVWKIRKSYPKTHLNGFFLVVHKDGGKEYLAECNHSLRYSVVAFIIAHRNAKIIHGNAEQCDHNAGNQVLGCFQWWQQHKNHTKHNKYYGNAGMYANWSR